VAKSASSRHPKPTSSFISTVPGFEISVAVSLLTWVPIACLLPVLLAGELQTGAALRRPARARVSRLWALVPVR